MAKVAYARASSTAKPAVFFDRWKDMDSWPQWSTDTKWVKLNGPFEPGTYGVMQPTGGPKVKFVIAAVKPNREYTDVSLLPGASLRFEHLVEPTPTGSALEVTVTVTGPLALVWRIILGSKFRTAAQSDLDRLVRIAETT
jgi:hypothetical protein